MKIRFSSRPNRPMAAWTHPSTGEVRIYLEGPGLSQGDRLYLTEATGGVQTYDAHLVTSSPMRPGAARDLAETLAEAILKGRGLSFRTPWADLVSAALAP